MTKEILVAGGTGLVGANLTFKLKSIGINVISTKFKNYNILFNNFHRYNFKEFEECLEATKNKNAVVICAGNFHGIQKNNRTETLLPNVQINLGLLEAAAQNNVKTVVMISTSTIYQNAFHAIREDELDLNAPPYAKYFGVAWSFRYLEEMAKFYSNNYGMRIVIFRPTNIYGPFDNFQDGRSHVVPALIKRALRREDPFVVWGNPNTVRDFVFVEDVVEDIVESIVDEEIPTLEPFNLCNGCPITIKNTVDVILEECGHTPEIIFDKTKPTAIPFRALSNAKYKVYFGERQRTSFRDGIRKTVDWYMENKYLSESL